MMGRDLAAAGGGLQGDGPPRRRHRPAPGREPPSRRPPRPRPRPLPPPPPPLHLLPDPTSVHQVEAMQKEVQKARVAVVEEMSAINARARKALEESWKQRFASSPPPSSYSYAGWRLLQSGGGGGAGLEEGGAPGSRVQEASPTLQGPPSHPGLRRSEQSKGVRRRRRSGRRGWRRRRRRGRRSS